MRKDPSIPGFEIYLKLSPNDYHYLGIERLYVEKRRDKICIIKCSQFFLFIIYGKQTITEQENLFIF